MIVYQSAYDGVESTGQDGNTSDRDVRQKIDHGASPGTGSIRTPSVHVPHTDIRYCDAPPSVDSVTTGAGTRTDVKVVTVIEDESTNTYKPLSITQQRN